ncbi:unnamed protein product [Paramecium primaurelia]|uniref:Uncharacterized protein n=1 Tax=Paramecium primaurelia TaxID=5886 RepID=A0A8S1Q4N4_PARPR|nr:unnamed protein product [Paramecium primaurelia]
MLFQSSYIPKQPLYSEKKNLQNIVNMVIFHYYQKQMIIVNNQQIYQQIMNGGIIKQEILQQNHLQLKQMESIYLLSSPKVISYFEQKIYTIRQQIQSLQIMGQFLYKQGIWRMYGSYMQKEKLLLLEQVKFVMILIQLLMQKQTLRMQIQKYLFNLQQLHIYLLKEFQDKILNYHF